MTPTDRIPAVWVTGDWIGPLPALVERALFCVAFASAASIIFSIAISQILLAIGLVMLLVLRPRINFPPIKLPLALFFIATLIADLLSGHPFAGLPQIRKFYVFGIVALISCVLRSGKRIGLLLLAWIGLGVLSAIDGFVHVFLRWQEAIRLKWNIYDYLLDDRVTGFASHWMTFGGEQMIVLLMVVSFLLFGCRREWVPIGWCCAIVLWISLMFGLTRSIFLLGVPIGLMYLVASWKPWTLAAIPVLAIVSYYAMPPYVRERAVSVVSPHAGTDSNVQRQIMRRTGWQMVKAHPWFGLGPEQIKPQFESYVPADIPRPLPRGWYGHLHNIYLQYAAERGIPALLFLLWMIGKMLNDFVRALRTRMVDNEERYIVLGAVAVICGVLAEGLFEYNLGDSEILTMVLVVAACAYNVIQPRSQIILAGAESMALDDLMQYGAAAGVSRHINQESEV